MYSYSNNAVINNFTDVTRRGSDTVVDFNDYKVGRHYFTVTPTNGNTTCHASPLNGNIFVPTVATFVFNGREAPDAPGNWPAATLVQRQGNII